MPKYSREEFDNLSQKLPPPLRDALFDPDVAEKIFETGKSTGLTIDEIGALSDEIGGIILGIAKPSDFIKNLSESLAIDQDKAHEIAGRINHEIFLPLRDALKTTHQFDFSGETMQKGEPIIKKPASVPLPATALATAGATAGRPEPRLGREPIEEHELTPKAPPQATTFRARPTDTAVPAKPLTPPSTPTGIFSPSILHPLQSKPAVEVKPSIAPPKLPPNVIIGIPQRPATSAPKTDTELQPKPAGTSSAPSWAVKPAEKPLSAPKPEPATPAALPKIPSANITAGKPLDEALNLEDEIRRALEGLDRNKSAPAPTAPAIPAVPASPPINTPPLSQNKIPEDKPIDLRSQYKPIIPPHSPKVPPINLRDQGIKNTEPNASAPKITPGITSKPSVAPILPPSPAPQNASPLSGIAEKPVLIPKPQTPSTSSPEPKIPSTAPPTTAKPADMPLIPKIPSAVDTIDNKLSNTALPGLKTSLPSNITTDKPAGEIKPAEKKMPSSGMDKYREPLEQ